MNGLITSNAKKPCTTEGIPDSTSTIGLRTLLDRGDANSPRCRAAATPSGMDMAREPIAIRAVPDSNGHMPKLGFRPFGSQFVPVKNSARLASP